MANEIPKLTFDNIAPQRAMPTPYRAPDVSPQSQGAGVGLALEHLGAEGGSIAHRERMFNAQMDAYSAEAKHGDTLDNAVEDFKVRLRGIKDDGHINYPEAVRMLRQEFAEKVNESQKDAISGLKDSLARKMFDVRMRLQNQTAMRHFGTLGDRQIQEWDKNATASRVDGYIRRASRVTGDISQDLQNIGIQAGLASKDVDDFNARNGIPGEKAKTKMEVRMAGAALGGYGSNWQAGLAFLGSKLPDGSTVGFNPNGPPDQKSILDGEETQKWVKHFTEHKSTQISADFGEMLFQQRHEKGFNLENRLTDAIKSGYVTPEEAGKARQHYVNAVSDGHRLHEISQGYTYDSTFKTVNEKYGGDLDKALAAKDDAFLRQWKALGPKLQVNLRAALAKEEKLDGAAYGPLGSVIDLAGTPGALEKKYPTTESFAKDFQGPTKHLWPQALKMYEADVKRDRSQDIQHQQFQSDVDIKLRDMLGFKRGLDPRMNYWENADEEKQAVRSWVTSVTSQAWADHVQARKETRGKVSDVLWWKDTVNEVMKEATRLYKAKAFRNGATPAIMDTPVSAVNIKSDHNTIPEMTEAQYNAAPSGTMYRVPGSNTVLKKP
jgi:hypothetical protein